MSCNYIVLFWACLSWCVRAQGGLWASVNACPGTLWMALFAERTRFTETKLKAAHKFATDSGLHVPRHVPISRTEVSWLIRFWLLTFDNTSGPEHVNFFSKYCFDMYSVVQWKVFSRKDIDIAFEFEMSNGLLVCLSTHECKRGHVHPEKVMFHETGICK